MAWAAGNLYNGSAVLSAECSGSSEYSATYPATKAFDNETAVDVDNCWMSSDANTPEVDGSCYLEWDFTQTMFIAGVQLQRRDSTAGQLTNYPKDIVVKAKKDVDVDWTIVATVSLASPADGAWGAEVPFDPQYATHWDKLRIEFHTVHYRGVVGWNVCVKEVRFLGRAKVGALTVVYRADLDGAIVAEETGSQNDYGYIGVTGQAESALVTEFAMGYREHDRYGDGADHRFTWDSSTSAIKMEEAVYSNRSAGYLQAVFANADIDGLYAAYKINLEDSVVADLYLRVTDGAYDYTSLVDYPQDLAPISKGAGSLQTLTSQTTDSGSVTKTDITLLSLSGGSETDVTLRLEHLKNSDNNRAAQCYVYYLVLSNLGIIDAYRGAVDLPMSPLLGSAIDFSGDVSLPTFSIVAVCEGGVGYAALPCPLPEQVTNLGDVTLPIGPLTAEGYLPLRGEAWLPTPEAWGLMGGRQEEADLPLGNIEASSFVGWTTNGTAVLPAPLVGGLDGAWGRMSLSFGLTGAGVVSALANGLANLPIKAILGAGSAAQMAIGDSRVPAPIPSGRAITTVTTMRGTVQAQMLLTGIGQVGILIQGSAILPLDLSGVGYAGSPAAGSAVLPLPEGYASPAATPAQAGGLLTFHRGF